MIWLTVISYGLTSGFLGFLLGFLIGKDQGTNISKSTQRAASHGVRMGGSPETGGDGHGGGIAPM